MMDKENRIRALEIIDQAQRKNCASVTVEIGGTSDSGQVEHDTLYLHDAPAKIVNALRDAKYTLSVSDGAVRVDDYKRDDA